MMKSQQKYSSLHIPDIHKVALIPLLQNKLKFMLKSQNEPIKTLPGFVARQILRSVQCCHLVDNRRSDMSRDSEEKISLVSTLLKGHVNMTEEEWHFLQPGFWEIANIVDFVRVFLFIIFSQEMWRSTWIYLGSFISCRLFVISAVSWKIIKQDLLQLGFVFWTSNVMFRKNEERKLQEDTKIEKGII